MSNNLINHNTIGEIIKFYRKRAEFSQSQLEVEAGLALGALTRIERNVVSPSKETISKIGKALNLSSMELAYLFKINLYRENYNSDIRKSV